MTITMREALKADFIKEFSQQICPGCRAGVPVDEKFMHNRKWKDGGWDCESHVRCTAQDAVPLALRALGVLKRYHVLND